MIGDWVKCTDPKCEGHQVDLIDLANEEVGLDGEINNFENIIPIPLTPEILEKNGFKYSEWYGWQIKEPDFTLCFVGDTPHFLLDDIFVCNCPYVHTLQHALKLCGIEKEIIL